MSKKFKNEDKESEIEPSGLLGVAERGGGGCLGRIGKNEKIQILSVIHEIFN
jgi:hypothetical protein